MLLLEPQVSDSFKPGVFDLYFKRWALSEIRFDNAGLIILKSDGEVNETEDL